MHRISLSSVFFFIMSTPVLAAEDVRKEDDKSIFNVVFENDIFAGSDSDYARTSH